MRMLPTNIKIITNDGKDADHRALTGGECACRTD
jgi:hypothetical protein